VDIFREITNFIDLKMKSIEEYKNVIKHNKININNLQMSCNKLNDKYNNLVKEYESYKILVEKNIEKNNKEYLKEKREKNKFVLNNNNNDFSRKNDIKNNDNDNYKSHLNLKRRNDAFSEDNKFSSDAESIGRKEKKRLFVKNLKKSSKKLMSAYKGNSIYNNYFYSIKNKSEKKLNNIGFNSYDNVTMNNYIQTKKENKIERNINKDKLVKENGNQEKINNLNKINILIDETNRLFLYKPRMGAFQKKFNTIECEEKINYESPNIKLNTNINNKTYEHNLVKTYEGKIMKKLDGLINITKIK
jgi:hypothetical protein